MKKQKGVHIFKTPSLKSVLIFSVRTLLHAWSYVLTTGTVAGSYMKKTSRLVL
jgi:hypothetical protein